MAKKIIRYLLEADGTVPSFVLDGGYFPIGEELVGISIDTSKRHLPKSIKVLSKEELQDRAGKLEADIFLLAMGLGNYE